MCWAAGRRGVHGFAGTALGEADSLCERLRIQVSMELLLFDGHSIPVTSALASPLTATDIAAGDVLVRVTVRSMKPGGGT